jgi:hypothetical protein
MIILVTTLLAVIPVFAQNDKMPILSPYELNGKGTVKLPENTNGKFFSLASHKMEITDLPKDIPYHSLAFFENDKLFTLHVLFGDTGEGLSLENYQLIKKILHKLWDYPSRSMNGRRGMDNLVEVWETTDFRIEWTYKNQEGSETKKMGWLFIYTRDKFIEEY